MDVFRRCHSSWSLLVLLLVLALPPLRAAERPSPAQTAAKVDASLVRGMNPATPLPVSDETFLRRVSLDLTGKLPDPDTLHRFVADRASDKRVKIIDELLKSEAYAVNWGRYWRDTLTYHTPASANYIRWKLFDEWMVEQFRRNRSWGEIVAALVTATGINDECAPVNYLTALYGNPVEIAATTSRVFLGVQLQCAQCHNARTEPWKREQFHELVAFFGRAKIIQHKDVDGRGTPYAIECKAEGQYQMTDKKDAARLIPMQPRFLTGESVALDAPDVERRQALARFLTSSQNPWFTRCSVNRIWTALMGWGFYPGVDELDNDVTVTHPKVLDLLAKHWVESGFDVRWLLR